MIGNACRPCDSLKPIRTAAFVPPKKFKTPKVSNNPAGLLLFCRLGHLCYWVSDTSYQVLTAVAPGEQMAAVRLDVQQVSVGSGSCLQTVSFLSSAS